jgi:hypothetical protein
MEIGGPEYPSNGRTINRPGHVIRVHDCHRRCPWLVYGAHSLPLPRPLDERDNAETNILEVQGR